MYSRPQLQAATSVLVTNPSFSRQLSLPSHANNGISLGPGSTNATSNPCFGWQWFISIFRPPTNLWLEQNRQLPVACKFQPFILPAPFSLAPRRQWASQTTRPGSKRAALLPSHSTEARCADQSFHLTEIRIRFNLVNPISRGTKSPCLFTNPWKRDAAAERASEPFRSWWGLSHLGTVGRMLPISQLS